MVVADGITMPGHLHINGLVQERCNSIANALELRFSCSHPSIQHDATDQSAYNRGAQRAR